MVTTSPIDINLGRAPSEWGAAPRRLMWAPISSGRRSRLGKALSPNLQADGSARGHPSQAALTSSKALGLRAGCFAA